MTTPSKQQPVAADLTAQALAADIKQAIAELTEDRFPDLMDAIDQLAALGSAPATPVSHATKENGDCPHWCRACAIEREERAAATPVHACGLHYIGGFRSTWGCDTCGFKGVRDAHPGCQRTQAATTVQPVPATGDPVGAFAIEVEKLLLAKLGRAWTPGGISIVSLIDELAANPAQPVPGSETVDTAIIGVVLPECYAVIDKLVPSSKDKALVNRARRLLPKGYENSFAAPADPAPTTTTEEKN